MLRALSFIMFCFLCNSVFASGKYTSSNGYFVVPNVNVDDQLFLDSVTLKLDLENGTFQLVEIKETQSQNSEQHITDLGYEVDLLECNQTGTVSYTSGDKKIVTCDIEVTNTQHDKLLSAKKRYVTNSSHVYDNFSDITVASSIRSGDDDAGLFSDGYIDVFQPNNTPVLIQFEFYLNINSTSITSFQPLLIDIETQKELDIEFTNIEF